MPLGYRFIEYNIGVNSSVIEKTITDEHATLLNFDVVSRGAFTANSKKKFFGFKFYGFEPKNLRIYLNNNYANIFGKTTYNPGYGKSALNKLNINVLSEDYAFKILNATAPTLQFLPTASGVSTSAITNLSDAPANYFRATSTAVGSILLVNMQANHTLNGLYVVDAVTSGRLQLSRHSSLDSTIDIKPYLRVKVFETDPEFYGIGISGFPYQIGISSLFFIKQYEHLKLPDCVGVATVNISNFSVGPLSVDNVNIKTNDIILVNAQTDRTQNGMYIVSGISTSGSVLERVIIKDNVIFPQMFTKIQNGHTYKDKIMVIGLGTQELITNNYLYKVGISSFNFYPYTEAIGLSTNSPDYWYSLPYMTYPTTFSENPIYLNTYKSPNNENIFYSDVIGIAVSVPNHQIDSMVRSLTLGCDFETMNANYQTGFIPYENSIPTFEPLIEYFPTGFTIDRTFSIGDIYAFNSTAQFETWTVGYTSTIQSPTIKLSGTSWNMTVWTRLYSDNSITSRSAVVTSGIGYTTIQINDGFNYEYLIALKVFLDSDWQVEDDSSGKIEIY